MINTLDFPTGSVTPFSSPYGSLPAGWIKCDGAPYDKETDALAPLFNIIGYTYGGADSTFYVPNLGQRIVVCGTPGEWYGIDKVALTAAQSGIPKHSHSINETAHTHTISDKGHSHAVHYSTEYVNLAKASESNKDFFQSYNESNLDRMSTEYSGIDTANPTGSSEGAFTYVSGSPAAQTTSSTTSSPGSPHENRMPFVVMQYLIKL